MTDLPSGAAPFSPPSPPRREGNPAPAVTAIIPTYNRPALCAQAIESVLAQTFRDFELIVVDDGSLEDTGRMLAGFGDRLRTIRQTNAGVSVARNAAAAQASGRYLAFLDHDDLWMPEKLEVMVPAFDAAPEAGMAYSSVRHLDESGEQRSSDDATVEVRSGRLFQEIFAREIRISTSSMMVRREVFAGIGGYDPALPVAQDYDLHLRIALRSPVLGVPRVLTAVRFTRGSGGQNRIQAHRDIITVLERTWGRTSGTPDQPPERTYRRLLAHRHLKLGRRLLSVGEPYAAREAFARAWQATPLSIDAMKWWARAWSRAPGRPNPRPKPEHPTP